MDRLEGPSAYYAATEFEARLCRGDPVAVVGGGNYAGQAALFLARNASDVDLVIRHDNLNRDMSPLPRRTDSFIPARACLVQLRESELLGDLGLEEVVVRDLGTDLSRRRLSSC